MAKRKTTDESTSESFETALERLQQVVQEIESGKLTLDQSLAKYETGVKYLRACYAKLDQVEKKLRLLVDIDNSGTAVTRNFKHESSFSKSDEDDDFDDDSDPDGLF